MDQVVVLQKIYESFSKGDDGLQEISNKTIEGDCPDLLGKLSSSIRKGRIDEDICRELSLKIQDVYELKRLGDICRLAGLHSLALSTYNQALAVSSDPLLRPVLQNNLGQAYASQRNLAKAVFYYQEAADGFARENDEIGLAHVLGNLGSAFRRCGEWDKAIEHCYKSLKIFEEKSDGPGIAQMTGSIGRIYADMGELELAARYFERSLTDFKRLGDKKSAAWVQDRLGRIAAERKDWDRAISHFHKSHSLFEELGQNSSQGIVFANLGRLYLEMGEADAALEPLEKSTMLISRHIKPYHQRSLYFLAKTYNALAKKRLQEAENERSGCHAGQKPRRDASRLFARASDRYHELASTCPGGEAEIKAKAAMARSWSYLARLLGPLTDEEALSLSEKTAASLDAAAANAGGDEKAAILGLQRIICSMKEACCAGHLGNDPSLQSRSLTNASEYLLGSIQGDLAWRSYEARAFLSDALKNINSSIRSRISGKGPDERLLDAAVALRHAQKHFSAAEKEEIDCRARMIGRAAEMLEEEARSYADESQLTQKLSAGDNETTLQPEKEALLLIAKAMAIDSLAKIDEGDLLKPMPEAEKVESAIKIRINDLPIEPDPIAGMKLPALEISEEQNEAKDLILADGTVEGSDVVSYTIPGREDWLAPIKAEMACQSQFLLPLKRELCDSFRDHPINSEIEDQIDNKIEDARQSISECVPDHADVKKGAPERFFNQANALSLLKALTVLTVMLLAIEAIIYLI